MILSVTYNKTSGEITVSSDLSSITVEVNNNTVQDNSSELSFEVALDTSIYEASQTETENTETPED